VGEVVAGVQREVAVEDAEPAGDAGLAGGVDETLLAFDGGPLVRSTAEQGDLAVAAARSSASSTTTSASSG
jgi:hypothetical protein